VKGGADQIAVQIISDAVVNDLIKGERAACCGLIKREGHPEKVSQWSGPSASNHRADTRGREDGRVEPQQAIAGAPCRIIKRLIAPARAWIYGWNRIFPDRAVVNSTLLEIVLSNFTRRTYCWESRVLAQRVAGFLNN